MKAKLSLLAVLCLCCGFIVGTKIEWTFQNKPIIELKSNGETLSLGLRSDGVVVWRKITNTTNSPAEELNNWFNGSVYTNVITLPNYDPNNQIWYNK